VALDRQGNLIVADTSNHRLRKVTTAGVVTTLAGAGALGVWGGGFADGPAGTAQFKRPYGVAVDALGAIYVADKDNQRLRRLANGTVTTVAGTGTAGLGEGYGPLSRLNEPVGLAIDSQGRLVVADTANHVLRRLYP
jgi:sugar lactone lactonase YvrE